MNNQENERYQATLSTYNTLAEAYQNRFMDLDLYHDSYNKFCDLLVTPNARILEIGCGPGNVSKHLLSKRPDYIIEGVDVAPNMVKLAQTNNPQAHYEVMNCRDIISKNKMYDAIFCGFCIPYISKEDCSQLIADTAKLLNKGGLAHFSMMEGEYENSAYEFDSSGQHKCYIYYYPRTYITQVLKENNLEMVEFKTQDYTKRDGSVIQDLFFYATKQS